MSNTPNLGIAEVPQNATQPSYPVNAALRVLDAVAQLAVESTTNTPPTTVAGDVGKRWIVGTSPTGAWAGQAGKVALCVGAALWQYLTPKEGWAAYDRGADVWRDYDGSAWAQRVSARGAEFAGAITGLKMEWVSGTAITVTSGAAHIESLGRVVSVASAIAKTGLSLAASSWFHVYLYLNAGSPDVEIVSTAPAAAYSGTARSKTSDSSRRYLGSVRTDGSGNVINFIVVGCNQVLYRAQQDSALFRLLNNGTATSETTVSLANAVPATARAAILRLTNSSASPSNSNFYTGISDDSASGPPFSGLAAVGINSNAFLTHPVDSSQAVTYWYSTAPSSSGGYIDVYGYIYER